MSISRHLFLTAAAMAVGITASAGSWIRINQLGYIPNSTKVAVFVTVPLAFASIPEGVV